MSTQPTRRQPVDLGDGVTVYVEAVPYGRQEVGILDSIPFAEVVRVISKLAGGIGDAIDHAKPTKAAVEIGLEFGIEAGQLVALIARGSGTANLKVTMEWEKR